MLTATNSVAYPRELPDLNEHGDRVVDAAKLYKEGKAPLIVLSGGRINWFGNEESEAVAMKNNINKSIKALVSKAYKIKKIQF